MKLMGGIGAGKAFRQAGYFSYPQKTE